LTVIAARDYPRSVRRRIGVSTFAFALTLLGAAPGALAQPAEEGIAPEGPGMEEPDPTRLDVARLPPEAIEITRDLYSHGFFLDAGLGGRGFIGGAGDVARGGPYMQIGLGYEIKRWLWVRLGIEGSMHQTDAPGPPATAVFEVLGTFAALRFQIDMTARAALFLGGEFGLVFTTDDVLQSYGVHDADKVGITYGGELGFDWHFRNRHHSVGLLGGARAYPSLSGFDGKIPVGVHGTTYLRYVFGD
jgi:hypothetical protein